ncbi:hypothetical protein BGZ61DRAFT_457833 [Ilyonectria robusta]|uniref:uncharacterized protein n=1 Tax=Ilyonectria robusta TaxID=1079257 RepID=UPI001E8DB1F7|nr:uncharacterized protein BGZ61DRAFT_457833 [Ilyonectria robusta]KAH8677219.1 hypothetical protein BGZ61DRAFT_457833 [Ilyonectria robusta]
MGSIGERPRLVITAGTEDGTKKRKDIILSLLSTSPPSPSPLRPAHAHCLQPATSLRPGITGKAKASGVKVSVRNRPPPRPNTNSAPTGHLSGGEAKGGVCVCGPRADSSRADSSRAKPAHASGWEMGEGFASSRKVAGMGWIPASHPCVLGSWRRTRGAG